MIIACPSCSAKYQLADAKIKSSGTKVRCPRCSHTFTVYREQDDSYSSDRTELFVRRDEALQKPVPTQKPSTSKPHDDFHGGGFDESLFDQKTSVSVSPSPEPRAEAPRKVETPKPPPGPKREEVASAVTEAPVKKEKPVEQISKKIKEDPARVVTPEAVEEDEDTRPRAENPAPPEPFDDSQPSKEFRPFGDATLFEIQKGFKKPGSKRILKIAAVVAGVAILALIVQKLWNGGLPTSSTSSVEIEADAPYDVVRPGGWYKDDPQVYQETLGQLAALPADDQDRAENRALLAETLILSGLLNGATDQVISGMGFASSLVVSHPFTPLGYYGIAAYALWNEDKRTLKDLVDRWPEAYRDEPEFNLVDAANDIAKREYIDGFRKFANLLKAEPDFQRANDYALSFILRHPKPASDFFDEKQIDRMKTSFRQHKALLERELKALPRLHLGIEGQLNSEESKKTSPTKTTSQRKPSAPKTAKANSQNDVPIPPEKTFPNENGKVEIKPPPPKPAPKAAAKPNSSRLPAPSANLIAQNKISEKQRLDANRLFESGNDLYKQGKADEALKTYRDALKLNPEFADIYKRIGMIYMSRQESERALRSFKIYLQLKPDSDDKQLVEGWISSLQ